MEKLTVNQLYKLSPWQQCIWSRCAAATSALTINTAAWIFRTSHLVGGIPDFDFFSQKLGSTGREVRVHEGNALPDRETSKSLDAETCVGKTFGGLGLGHCSDTLFCSFRLLHFGTKCLMSFSSCFIKPQGPAAGKHSVCEDTCVSSTHPWCTGLLFPP